MLMDNPFSIIDRRFNRLESLLEKVIEHQELKVKNANSSKPLLSRNEATQYLNISLGTLRTLTATGQLCCVYIGRNPKYSIEDLETFINSRK